MQFADDKALAQREILSNRDAMQLLFALHVPTKFRLLRSPADAEEAASLKLCIVSPITFIEVNGFVRTERNVSHV